jgi:hypothetical protein
MNEPEFQPGTPFRGPKIARYPLSISVVHAHKETLFGADASCTTPFSDED